MNGGSLSIFLQSGWTILDVKKHIGPRLGLDPVSGNGRFFLFNQVLWPLLFSFWPSIFPLDLPLCVNLVVNWHLRFLGLLLSYTFLPNAIPVPLGYTCAAKAIFYCPSMNSHRPRSHNTAKDRALFPEKDSTRKRPRSHVSLEKSSKNYKPLKK